MCSRYKTITYAEKLIAEKQSQEKENIAVSLGFDCTVLYSALWGRDGKEEASDGENTVAVLLFTNQNDLDPRLCYIGSGICFLS